MFSKIGKPVPAPIETAVAQVVARSPLPSIIGADLRIVGDLSCNGDVHVSGWVQGDIMGRKVTIEQHATILGNLQADAIRIRGLVNGDVRADVVVLESSSRMTGNIIHRTLAIEEGAYLEGSCRPLAQNPAPIITVDPQFTDYAADA
jgi:cytoskeletal protein CcmA (bactofilin family)